MKAKQSRRGYLIKEEATALFSCEVGLNELTVVGLS